MSMLTPPGMGGKYRITGDKYPRMRPPRRRARLVAAVVASVAVLGLVGWGTLQLIDVFTGGGMKTTAAGRKAHCRTQAAATVARAKNVPAPGRITVNVYNATKRGGLAKQTADELKKRGFRIGAVGNASKDFDKKVKGTGVLLGPATALDSSLPVLATQLGGAERRTDAGRKGADVDLIIGDGFKGLAQPATAARALSALSAPAPSPSADAPQKGC
ncbi:LytR C-terminal domain-containing protein [Streptomyces sp. NPDC048514]|uniref:LytR C-terminal domain-containing protein n=1 Tax=Streptomyces sp. NPDC048514 TaxID=3365564 RepID=UPI0037154E3F